MSSILDALEKAKRERENVQRGKAAPPSQPAPSQAQAPGQPQGQPQGPFPPHPGGYPPGAVPPPMAPPYAQPYMGAPPAPAASGGLRSIVFGMTLGIALFATAALVFVLSREPSGASGGQPEATPSPTPVPTATPTPEPTPSPTPTPTPAPTPEPTPESSNNISIEDIRYGSARSPESMSADQIRHIVITPTPTPYVHQPRQGDAPALFGPDGAPLPHQTPAPTPTPTPTPPEPTTREVFSEDFSEFKIDGIFFESDRPAILVAGRERVVGDVVFGFEIQAIDSKAITLKKGYETIRVRF